MSLAPLANLPQGASAGGCASSNSRLGRAGDRSPPGSADPPGVSGPPRLGGLCVGVGELCVEAAAGSRPLPHGSRSRLTDAEPSCACASAGLSPALPPARASPVGAGAVARPVSRKGSSFPQCFARSFPACTRAG